MSTLSNYWGLPGMGTVSESSEVVFTWGPADWRLVKSIQLDSATVDARNTPTTDLSPGLVLAKLTASDEWVNYSSTGTNGSQLAEGFLWQPVRMLNQAGSAVNQTAVMLVAGPVKPSGCGGIDNVSRAQLRNRFILDDDLPGNPWPFKQEVAKTADYTVGSTTSALLESGTLYTNTGDVDAINFTLPTLAKGLIYHFLAVADFGMTITSAAGDDMVTVNDASADSVAFSTAGDIIGGSATIASNAAGTKWLVYKTCPNAMTIVS